MCFCSHRTPARIFSLRSCNPAHWNVLARVGARGIFQPTPAPDIHVKNDNGAKICNYVAQCWHGLRMHFIMLRVLSGSGWDLSSACSYNEISGYWRLSESLQGTMWSLAHFHYGCIDIGLIQLLGLTRMLINTLGVQQFNKGNQSQSVCCSKMQICE